jgi:hypothetical protein
MTFLVKIHSIVSNNQQLSLSNFSNIVVDMVPKKCYHNLNPQKISPKLFESKCQSSNLCVMCDKIGSC